MSSTFPYRASTCFGVLWLVRAEEEWWRSTPKHLSMFWAAVQKAYKRPSPLQLTRTRHHQVLPRPPFWTVRCLLTPSLLLPGHGSPGIQWLPLSPVWAQGTPTPWGFGLEQTGHVGMSVWGKSKVAARAGQGVGGLMLKSGSAELPLAGGNSTLPCLTPSTQRR